MKMQELIQLSKTELEEQLLDAQEEHQNLRFQHATRQLENAMRLKEVRRGIARIRTVLQEMELGLRPAGSDSE